MMNKISETHCMGQWPFPCNPINPTISMPFRKWDPTLIDEEISSEKFEFLAQIYTALSAGVSISSLKPNACFFLDSAFTGNFKLPYY